MSIYLLKYHQSGVIRISIKGIPDIASILICFSIHLFYQRNPGPPAMQAPLLIPNLLLTIFSVRY